MEETETCKRCGSEMQHRDNGLPLDARPGYFCEGCGWFTPDFDREAARSFARDLQNFGTSAGRLLGEHLEEMLTDEDIGCDTILSEFAAVREWAETVIEKLK